MAIIIPTDQEIVERIAGAITSAIETVGELDEPREAAEWEVEQVLQRFTFEPDQDMDSEEQLDDLRYEIQNALDDIHAAVQDMQNGDHFHVELIYTYEIENYYTDHTDECDQYFDECKDMASDMDSLKSYLVHMALSDQASQDVYDLSEAIADIDPEDIV